MEVNTSKDNWKHNKTSPIESLFICMIKIEQIPKIVT